MLSIWLRSDDDNYNKIIYSNNNNNSNNNNDNNINGDDDDITITTITTVTTMITTTMIIVLIIATVICHAPAHDELGMCRTTHDARHVMMQDNVLLDLLNRGSVSGRLTFLVGLTRRTGRGNTVSSSMHRGFWS